MDNVTQLDQNLATWATKSARHDLDSVAGFTDPGERAAFDFVAREARGQPVLDIGVGTGRTIPLLSPLASQYHAIDYVPEMVDTCRDRYPGVNVTLGDARTLEGFKPSSFRLVTFSYNGIDAVSHHDRMRVLAAVRRVLSPRGLFFFSTLNLHGPTYRERPWRLRVWPTKNPAKYAYRAAKQLLAMPLDTARWLRIARATEAGEGYAVAPLSAHHYGVLSHYTTVGRQLDELSSTGFEPSPVVFESKRGARVRPGDDTSASDWFHIVARAV